jgi:NADPH-dependent ferric siderophore reductase
MHGGPMTQYPTAWRLDHRQVGVPPEQADQLYLVLRLLGREVEYRRFPDEVHELSRGGSPRHRVQRAEILLDFFARHLGGPPRRSAARHR